MHLLPNLWHNPKTIVLKFTSLILWQCCRNLDTEVQNSWTCMHSQNRWAIVSIVILQKSQSVELTNWHLAKNWLVGIMQIKNLYWKFFSLISLVDFCNVVYIFFQFKFSSENVSFHFYCAFISLNSGVLMNSLYITLFDDLPSFNTDIIFWSGAIFSFSCLISILLVYCSKCLSI